MRTNASSKTMCIYKLISDELFLKRIYTTILHSLLLRYTQFAIWTYVHIYHNHRRQTYLITCVIVVCRSAPLYAWSKDAESHCYRIRLGLCLQVRHSHSGHLECLECHLENQHSPPPDFRLSLTLMKGPQWNLFY